MIFGCCKICESVICGPGYCLLLPADAATVLLPLTPKHKHTKLNATKTQDATYEYQQSSLCYVLLHWRVSFPGLVVVSPETALRGATIGDKNSQEQLSGKI